MRLLEMLASAFINTFGITQPTDAVRRRVSWFILALLLFTVIFVVAVSVVLHQMLHR